jgi:hypothetical protein
MFKAVAMAHIATVAQSIRLEGHAEFTLVLAGRWIASKAAAELI